MEASWRVEVLVTPANLVALGVRNRAVSQHVEDQARLGRTIWVRGNLTLADRRLRFIGEGSRRILGAKAVVMLHTDLGRPSGISLATTGFLYQDVALLLGKDEIRFRMGKRDANRLHAAAAAAAAAAD